MKTFIRHKTTPEVNGCRWCGVSYREHYARWVPGKGWHEFTDPTNAQRIARVLARLKERREGGEE